MLDREKDITRNVMGAAQDGLRACMTTSWDDGHPLDMNIANLLARYGLKGTFYTPMSWRLPVMPASEIRRLSMNFEVGSHTVHGVELTNLSDAEVCEEIRSSKRQIEEITGKQCAMFCFPSGRYKRHHLALLREAGYRGARTVELMSLEKPRLRDGIFVMGSTLQAFSHSFGVYLKNSIKRRKLSNLRTYLRHGSSSNWASAAESLLELALVRGGVFHLWGHSWEIEETQQWEQLESVFATMARYRDRIRCVTNSELCEHV